MFEVMDDKQPNHSSSRIAVDHLPNVASLLTPDQVAEALGTTTKTLANWRSRRTGPSFVRVAGRVYYPRSAYDAFWLEQTGGAA